MNNKLMSYEDAVKNLKELEKDQRIAKDRRKCFSVFDIEESDVMKVVDINRRRINVILTIIHLHKQSRKLWAEKRKYKEMVSGVSRTTRGSLR